MLTRNLLALLIFLSMLMPCLAAKKVVVMDGMPRLISADIDDEGWEDEWDDEDWDDEEWDDEDWDDEDEFFDDDEDFFAEEEADVDRKAPVKLQPAPKTEIKTSVTPAQEQEHINNVPINRAEPKYAEDPEELSFLKELNKDDNKYYSKDLTINTLFQVYGDELKGLNPEDPQDLKEINKLLEIVGTPKTRVNKDRVVSSRDYSGDPVINFSARNITVRDAFATLARISGRSITVSGAIQDRDSISVIEINNEPFTKAFFSMVQAAGVDFTVSGDTYTILRRTGTSRTKIFSLEPTEVDLNLPVLERLADISYDNEDLNSVIKDLTNKYGIDIVMTAAPTERITARIRNVNIEEAMGLLLSGSTFEFTRSGGAYIIYNKVNMNFALDKKAVMFPVKYLEAKNIGNLLPAELKSLVKVSEEQNSLLAEGSKEELVQLFKFLRIIDKPIYQVELDVKVVEVSKNFTQGRDVINDNLSFFTVGRDTVTSTTTTPSTDGAGQIVQSVTENVTNFGLKPFRLGNETISLFKNAPSVSQNRTFAQIKISQQLLVASGKTAKINLDEDRNIVLGQGQGAGQGGVVQNQQIQRITAGTSMSITPIIGDNGIITVKVEVEISENSASSNDQNVPDTTTRRRISSEVQVLDHETISIGGLFRDANSIAGAEVPFLARIPILGNLIGNKTKTQENRELIVLITPHQRTQREYDAVDEEIYVQAEVNDYSAR